MDGMFHLPMHAKLQLKQRGTIMIFCEDCRNYEQHFFEDQGFCQKKKQEAEATDPACDNFEPLEGQIKLEM